MEKQIKFNSTYTTLQKKFIAPEVKNFNDGNIRGNISYFDMSYITAVKFSDYLLDLPIISINQFIEEIKVYFNILKNQSSIEYINKTVFKFKLEQIELALNKSGLFYKKSVHETIKMLKYSVPDKPIPISFCHGDFTFSNMLFKENYIYLFDFLDSYIDSYIIDIVKLKQDTEFYWSLFIDYDIKPYHKTKLKQILSYIDKILEDYFKQDEFYLYWYDYLKRINLLRVLPYLNKRIEIEYIENKLMDMK